MHVEVGYPGYGIPVRYGLTSTISTDKIVTASRLKDTIYLYNMLVFNYDEIEDSNSNTRVEDLITHETVNYLVDRIMDEWGEAIIKLQSFSETKNSIEDKKPPKIEV